jgi:hypothetical protein
MHLIFVDIAVLVLLLLLLFKSENIGYMGI